jgi:hypothetical protein
MQSIHVLQALSPTYKSEQKSPKPIKGRGFSGYLGFGQVWLYDVSEPHLFDQFLKAEKASDCRKGFILKRNLDRHEVVLEQGLLLAERPPRIFLFDQPVNSKNFNFLD